MEPKSRAGDIKDMATPEKAVKAIIPIMSGISLTGSISLTVDCYKVSPFILSVHVYSGTILS
jgi:hypothetical protein